MITTKVIKDNIEECLEIRYKVFVDEQGFDESIEVDEFDKESYHVLLYKDGTAIATARFFELENYWKIGRVCILKEYRKLKLGNKLLNVIEEEIKKLGGKLMVLSSQHQTVGFYEKNGFVGVGEYYLEEGCKHLKMKKTVK